MIIRKPSSDLILLESEMYAIYSGFFQTLNVILVMRECTSSLLSILFALLFYKFQEIVHIIILTT